MTTCSFYRKRKVLGMALIAATLLTLCGCNPLSYLNLTIVIPLGLGGNTGIFNPPVNNDSNSGVIGSTTTAN